MALERKVEQFLARFYIFWLHNIRFLDNVVTELRLAHHQSFKTSQNSALFILLVYTEFLSFKLEQLSESKERYSLNFLQGRRSHRV